MRFLLISLIILFFSHYALSNHSSISALDYARTQISNTKKTKINFDEKVLQTARKEFIYSKLNNVSLDNIKTLLLKNLDTLSINVINTTFSAFQCISETKIPFNNKLIIIDYSLPSNAKRLWLFDLKNLELVMHTYSSHGLKSGVFETNYFSNTNGSKASSVGVFHTDKSYVGRYGLSLKLRGLENGFNSNAEGRNIVIHSAWYADEDFIKKYGRVGRSWGCPAIPRPLIQSFIDNIPQQSLLIIYYPSDAWVSKSKFLNCKKTIIQTQIQNLKTLPEKPEDDQRGAILFVDKNNDNKRDESEPILIVTAENYKLIFGAEPPLTRMLRRQMMGAEFIALNNEELKKLDKNNDHIINQMENLNLIYFVVPMVRNVKGYWITEFQTVNFGQIKEIKYDPQNPVIYTDKATVNLKSSDKFIRWLGL